MTAPAEPPQGQRAPAPFLPSYAYLLVGWRQFWPALLEETVAIRKSASGARAPGCCFLA